MWQAACDAVFCSACKALLVHSKLFSRLYIAIKGVYFFNTFLKLCTRRLVQLHLTICVVELVAFIENSKGVPVQSSTTIGDSWDLWSFLSNSSTLFHRSFLHACVVVLHGLWPHNLEPIFVVSMACSSSVLMKGAKQWLSVFAGTQMWVNRLVFRNRCMVSSSICAMTTGACILRFRSLPYDKSSSLCASKRVCKLDN